MANADDPFNDSDCEPLSLFHMASAFGAAAAIPPSSSAVLQAYHYLLPSSPCTTSAPLLRPRPSTLAASVTTLRQYVGDEQQPAPHVSVDVINSSSSCLDRTTSSSRSAAVNAPAELELLAAYHDANGGSGGGVNIFGLMDARVRQLERAVVEFNRALDMTALGPYFGDVGAQLRLISQDTAKRLSEVSTYYTWLVPLHNPLLRLRHVLRG
jgi:hypothetical protein